MAMGARTRTKITYVPRKWSSVTRIHFPARIFLISSMTASHSSSVL